MTYTNPEDRARNDKFRAEQPAKVLAAIAEDDKKAAIRDREAAELKLAKAEILLHRALDYLIFREIHAGELQAEIEDFLDEPKPDVAF